MWRETDSEREGESDTDTGVRRLMQGSWVTLHLHLSKLEWTQKKRYVKGVLSPSAAKQVTWLSLTDTLYNNVNFILT